MPSHAFEHDTQNVALGRPLGKKASSLSLICLVIVVLHAPLAVSSCELSAFKTLDLLEGYHVLPAKADSSGAKWDCSAHSEHLTYTLRARHGGEIHDLDSFGCAADSIPTALKYYYKKKADSSEISFLDLKDVEIFCAADITKTCQNLKTCRNFIYTAQLCPKFTQGTDTEDPQLKCEYNKWYFGKGKLVDALSVKIVCKGVPGRNKAAFYAEFKSGKKAPVRIVEDMTCENTLYDTSAILIFALYGVTAAVFIALGITTYIVRKNVNYANPEAPVYY